jgi:hypothetical protein
MSFVLMGFDWDHRGMSNVTNIPAGESTVVIRLATPADVDDLRRLAALDSARALLGTVLVAQSDGEIRAAYSVEQERAIADPFRPTAGLVELLRARTDLLLGDARARRRGQRRLGLAPARPEHRLLASTRRPRRRQVPPQPRRGGAGARAV